ncbi:hypothetical protein [Arenicella xantha]|uniref:Uncharacterized protein n=1 Tax=Arenicella xantha TaxID=644221 RepID=A0A395JH38_9GAMM|nr:hypothetical protein [Arenicella xantha]RBP47098.1 hypothetical protein DFR28_11061 [Arenicella xantha]
MIRVVIVLLVLFLIWVLFLSNLTKKHKIILTVITLILAAAGAWYDGATRSAKVGLISPSELLVCGITAQHTYRSNYDIAICLENTHASATLNRVGYAVTVSQCESGAECKQLMRLERDVLFSLAPETTGEVVQNLDFKGLNSSLEGLSWQAEIISVKAMK